MNIFGGARCGGRQGGVGLEGRWSPEARRRMASGRHEIEHRVKPVGRAIMLALTTLLLCVPTGGLGAEDAPVTGPSPRAVEALQLLESKDAYQRQKGFLRLEALREPSTLASIQTYLGSRDPETRAYALRAMAAIQGVGSVPLLLDVLHKEKHPRVRRAAILGMEPFAMGDPTILPALIRALRDSTTEVRITAVDVVSRIDDPRAREAIITRYKRERRRDVRRVLELAMKRLSA